MSVSVVLLVAFSQVLFEAAPVGGCEPIALHDRRGPTGTVCADAPGPGVVVVDLSDGWAPRLLSEETAGAQPYRATFIALANERAGHTREWATARRDRYCELFGIFPSISVVRAQLLDEQRPACHARIDDRPLVDIRGTLAPWSVPPSAGARALAIDALRAAQATCAARTFCRPVQPTAS